MFPSEVIFIQIEAQNYRQTEWRRGGEGNGQAGILYLYPWERDTDEDWRRRVSRQGFCV
jgi:hypothetical protein